MNFSKFAIIFGTMIPQSSSFLLPDIRGNNVNTASIKSYNKVIHPFISSSSSSLASTLNENDNDILIGKDGEETKNALTLRIALTREAGKNEKIKNAILSHPLLSSGTFPGVGFEVIELPCIEHATGSDYDAFINLIQEHDNNNLAEKFDYIVITSPEAAKVLSKALEEVGRDNIDTKSNLPKIAAVGKATRQVLEKEGFSVDFVPSKANGETLAIELPFTSLSPSSSDDDSSSNMCNVLYPCSQQAADTIPHYLQNERDDGDGKKFQVTRMNTYDTVSAIFTEEQLDSYFRGEGEEYNNKKIDIACFGSPSQVQGWLENMDILMGIENESDEVKRTYGNGGVYAACIGSTSGKACLESGRWHAYKIYYPKKNPGVEGWAESTVQAIGDAVEEAFWA